MKNGIQSIKDSENTNWDSLAYILRIQLQLPYSIHYTMFVKCL